MENSKMDRTEIMGKLNTIIEPWVDDSELMQGVNENTNLIADLNLDSIGILQLIIGAEKEFGISIKNDDIYSELLSKMSKLVKMIEDKIHENN